MGLSCIDLQRYPIDRLAAGGCAALIDRVGAQLAAVGYCELEGFLTADGLARMAGEAQALAPLAHRHSGASSPYLEVPEPHWPPGHPRLTFGPYSLGAVAYDLIPPESALRELYEADQLVDFLAASLGATRLHRYADPLGACNVAVMADGDELEWHFDQTDFVVSIALQSPEAGGEFECVPGLRTAEDERYDAVAEVLGGGREGLVRLPFRPGTLLLFQGRHSMHRVAPVRGSRDRLVALLGYDTKPGTVSSPLLQEARYGRVRPV